MLVKRETSVIIIAMIKRKPILTFIFLLSLLGLSACAYRPTVQQGNILSQSDLQSVHRGMRVSAVIDKLGNPVLSNIYPDGRLVYIYTLKRNRRQMKKRSLIVTFRSGRVVNTEVINDPKMPE